MFKKLSVILSVLLALCMVFCMTGCENGGSNSTPDSNSQPTSTPESDTTPTDSDTTSTEDDQEEESKPSTPAKPAGPTVVNPKTNIKLDEYYYGEFLSADGKTYSKLNFAFHDSGEWGYSYDYNLTRYYTKERCIEILSDMDMEFNEEEYENSITIKGVKYYTIDWRNMGSAHYCDFTDKAITLRDDDSELITLSLLTNGTLVIDKVMSKNFGVVGTVFTLEDQ